MADLLRSHELDPSNYEVATLVKKLKESSPHAPPSLAASKPKRAVIVINKDDDDWFILSRVLLKQLFNILFFI